MNLGMPELLVILLIIMLLFGARRLPDLAKGMGEAIFTFKRGMKGPDEKTLEASQNDSRVKEKNDVKVSSSTGSP